jgi:hypothetical protein
MREFTKSLMSYTWAMSLFPVQQMINILTPQGQRPNHPATEAFNNVAGAARDEFGRTLESTFRVGDNVQRAAVDAMFSVLTLGGLNRGGGSRGGAAAGAGPAATDWGQAAAGATQTAADWGRQTAAGTARAASDVGRGTASAFQQGVRAAQQTADRVGQAVGATARQGRRGDARAQDDWGRAGEPLTDRRS